MSLRGRTEAVRVEKMHHSFSLAAFKGAAFLYSQISERPFTHLINIWVGLCPCSFFFFSCACSLSLLPMCWLVLLLLLLRVKSSEQQLLLHLEPLLETSAFY